MDLLFFSCIIIDLLHLFDNKLKLSFLSYKNCEWQQDLSYYSTKGVYFQ
jgi:hypothetical protein